MITTVLNLIALILGIKGAYLLYKYSVPPFIQKFSKPTQFGGVGPTPEQIRLDKDYQKYSKRGFSLILASFLLQLVANLYSLCKYL
jgi:hypothetical protein